MHIFFPQGNPIYTSFGFFFSNIPLFMIRAMVEITWVGEWQIALLHDFL